MPTVCLHDVVLMHTGNLPFLYLIQEVAEDTFLIGKTVSLELYFLLLLSAIVVLLPHLH
jgi:hypothetical protein